MNRTDTAKAIAKDLSNNDILDETISLMMLLPFLNTSKISF